MAVREVSIITGGRHQHRKVIEMKILVIEGSPHSNGTSNALAGRFKEGASPPGTPWRSLTRPVRG